MSGRYQPATAPGTCAGPRCGGTFRAGAMIIVTRKGQTFCSPACEAAAERAAHPKAPDTPHEYGAGTRLSSLYTLGYKGLPLPRYTEKDSAGAAAWRRGRAALAALTARPKPVAPARFDTTG